MKNVKSYYVSIRSLSQRIRDFDLLRQFFTLDFAINLSGIHPAFYNRHVAQHRREVQRECLAIVNIRR